MKLLAYIIFVFLLIGCNKPKEEVVPLSQITPSSDSNDQKLNSSGEEKDSTLRIRNEFNVNGIEVDSLEFILKSMYPERFGTELNEKFKLNIGDESITYAKWSYSDSAKVMNAFYNWLDNFGERHKSIRVGESKNFQPTAFQLFVGDSTMVYISGESIDFSQWLNYHEKKGYGLDWNYLIEQKTNGWGRWYTFEDDKKVKYKIE